VSTEKAKQALRYALDGFARREDSGDLWVEGSTCIPVDRDELPVPGIVLLLLTDVMGMVNLGIHEKTAWYVPVGFRGHRVTISLEKFGMRVYVVPAKDSDERPEDIAREVIRRLQKAAGIIERNVLAGYGESQIREGRLTIANHSGRQRAMYEHFRETAITAFHAGEEPPEDIAPEGIFAGIGEKIHQSQVGAWNAIAAVNAYFSALEHELVLVSAFADFDPTEGALGDLIGDRWGEKFGKLFDLSEPDTNRVYARLHEVAETYRNPYSHGGFDKQGAALWFHVEGIGAVPARLSDIRSSPHFEFFPVQPDSFEDICNLLNETDKWLRSGTYGPAFEWIDAGLDVAYDPEMRADYRKLMDDEKFRRDLIERSSHEWERMANMDW
jgi:hypothetical protein